MIVVAYEQEQYQVLLPGGAYLGSIQGPSFREIRGRMGERL